MKEKKEADDKKSPAKRRTPAKKKAPAKRKPRKSRAKPKDPTETNRLTAKQASFAYLYVANGGNASASYREAYAAEKMTPEAVHVAASRLLNSAKVTLRIQSLRAELEEQHLQSLGRLLRELDKARVWAMSMDKPQPQAAVNAIMGKAKLLGYDRQAAVEVAAAAAATAAAIAAEMRADDNATAAESANLVQSASEAQLEALEKALESICPEMADAPDRKKRH